jgi:hypothetical protein
MEEHMSGLTYKEIRKALAPYQFHICVDHRLYYWDGSNFYVVYERDGKIIKSPTYRQGDRPWQINNDLHWYLSKSLKLHYYQDYIRKYGKVHPAVERLMMQHLRDEDGDMLTSIEPILTEYEKERRRNNPSLIPHEERRSIWPRLSHALREAFNAMSLSAMSRHA